MDSGVKERQCGPCTRCCEGWLKGNILGHEMKPGTPCHFVRANGCSIYERRPHSPCRTFRCGWLLENSPFPDDYRPDQLGAILVPITWRDKRAWIAVPTGEEPGGPLMAYLRDLTRRTGEPHLIKKPGKLLCFGTPDFQQDMVRLEQQGGTPW